MKRLQSLSIQLKGIFAVSFCRAIASAILSPIIALYLRQFLYSDVLVSAILLISNAVSIIGTLYASRIIEKLQRRRSMILLLILFTVVLLLFAFITHTPTILFIFIVYTLLFIVLQFNIIVYIDHFSSKASLGKWYGSNGLVSNLGWFVGPLLGGFIATQFSFMTVFLFASLFAFIALIIFIFSEPLEKKTTYHHYQYIWKALKPFFKNPLLRKIYLMGFGINMLYGLFLLLPLHFTNLHASISLIGLYLGLSALPWIVLEMPIGIWADRTKNEPRLFIWCYALLLILLPVFAITKISFIAFIILTGMTIATALLETTVISYFYRHVKESDIEYASVFMTHGSMGLFVGALYATLLLLIMPLSYIFMLLSIIMLICLITALSLKRKALPITSR